MAVKVQLRPIGRRVSVRIDAQPNTLPFLQRPNAPQKAPAIRVAAFAARFEQSSSNDSELLELFARKATLSREHVPERATKMSKSADASTEESKLILSDSASEDGMSDDESVARNPNALNPDALNPDALNPNALNPAALNPDALNPGARTRNDISDTSSIDTSEHDALSDVYSDLVNPNSDAPIYCNILVADRLQTPTDDLPTDIPPDDPPSDDPLTFRPPDNFLQDSTNDSPSDLPLDDSPSDLPPDDPPSDLPLDDSPSDLPPDAPPSDNHLTNRPPDDPLQDSSIIKSLSDLPPDDSQTDLLPDDPPSNIRSDGSDYSTNKPPIDSSNDHLPMVDKHLNRNVDPSLLQPADDMDAKLDDISPLNQPKLSSEATQTSFTGHDVASQTNDISSESLRETAVEVSNLAREVMVMCHPLFSRYEDIIYRI